MTYYDFLSNIFTPVSYFANWLSSMASSLLNNYFFITILGLTLIISLVYLIYDIFDFCAYSHINDYDDYENKYYDYSLYREVKDNYNNNHHFRSNFSNSINLSGDFKWKDKKTGKYLSDSENDEVNYLLDNFY